jgi:hypothetical protein
VRKSRPAAFKGRHFQEEVILLCVRWYLRYSLSYRDLEELMAERNLSVDHSRKLPVLSLWEIAFFGPGAFAARIEEVVRVRDISCRGPSPLALSDP